MKYVVTIQSANSYIFDCENYTEEEAISQALEFFAEREPCVVVKKLAPCQMNGTGECPYPITHHCSDCK